MTFHYAQTGYWPNAYELPSYWPVVGVPLAGQYVLPPETVIVDRLVLWLDDLAPGLSLPVSGTVELLDPSGTVVARLIYSAPNLNEAWAGASVTPTPGA